MYVWFEMCYLSKVYVHKRSLHITVHSKLLNFRHLFCRCLVCVVFWITYVEDFHGFPQFKKESVGTI
jgi:hypothetical protein